VLVGEASLLHAGVRDFARLGFLVAGKAGAVITGLWLILDLGFGTSGKMLTGVLALEEISGGKSCKIIYGLVSLRECRHFAVDGIQLTLCPSGSGVHASRQSPLSQT
jgi:hypothetical protein